MCEITIDVGSGETEVWVLPSDMDPVSLIELIGGRGPITNVEFL